MEVFSLEDDDANLFITQESNTDRIKSQEVLKQPQYDNISDDDSLKDFDLGARRDIQPTFE